MNRLSRKPHKVYSTWEAKSVSWIKIADEAADLALSNVRPVVWKEAYMKSDIAFNRIQNLCRLNNAHWTR